MSDAALSPLKFDVRADLFGQLAVMEEAGLPFDKALSVTRLPPNVQARLTNMRKYFRLGLGVADAGLKGGLFTPLEASLLRAAFNAGSPSRTYRRLSSYYSRRAARVAAMKSRMMLPMAMIVIAIFVKPLPSLVAGTLSAGGYLLKCLLPLIALGGIAYLFTEGPRRLQPISSAFRNIPLERAWLSAPLFGSMSVRRNVRDFFDSLALLLEAGMPILDALPIAVDAVRNQALQQRFSQVKPRIEAGASFAQAVGELSFVGRTKAYAMILTGESSGKLPEMLFRYSEDETAAINRFDDLVAEWIPRVVYTSAALSIGYGILSSGAFMPSLPQDLR